MTKPYPISSVFTNATELIHALGLSHKYEVTDVHSFGYVPSTDTEEAGMFLQVYTRDENGAKSGTELIVRWLERDMTYTEWAATPPVVG